MSLFSIGTSTFASPAPAPPEPPPGPAVAPPGVARPIEPWQDAEIQSILGLLRQIRATCQYLDAALAKLDESLKGASAELRRAGVLEQAIDRRAELAAGLEKGGGYLEEATSLLQASPYLRDWIGDEVTRIQLNWTDVQRNALEVDAALAKAQSRPGDVLPDSLATDVRAARDAARVIILASAAITIPLRLNQHLVGANPGQEVTFKSLFEDELPEEADRAEVLRRIAEAPAAVNGVVDLASGTITAVSPSKRRRRLSYLGEAIALVGGGMVAYLVVAFTRGYFLAENGIRIPDAAARTALNQLVVSLVVFAAGAAFHLIVDLLKARQGSVGAPQWSSLDDWLLWLHAREIKVVSSIVTLWVVFGAVLVLAPGNGLPDGPTAFFAGYSFDSLADVVIKRFDSIAPDHIAKVTKIVSGEATATS